MIDKVCRQPLVSASLEVSRLFHQRNKKSFEKLLDENLQGVNVLSIDAVTK